MFSLNLTPTAQHSHLLFLQKSSGFFLARIPISCFTVRSSSSLQEVEKFSESSEERKDLSSELYASVPFPLIKTSKRVVLVRHGQSTWNAEGRIQGSSNFSVLTKKGESQAETSRQMLIDDAFDVCFSSPLVRSKRTAEIIWGDREAVILTDSELREIDLYSFQGLLKHEGKEKFGAAYSQWQVDAANFNIDGHYPVRELWARARNCWDRILAHESRSVLVVAHNAVNQALVATAIGLGAEYFRVLLQSNCGVSVLDFNPHVEDGSPIICLNRLNQTPNSPVASGSTGGRKTAKRIILVCHGVSGTNEASSSFLDDKPLNILGTIQSQKVAELLLDLKVSAVISSPKKACIETAAAICRVQEAADCLGADCVPRYVEMKQTNKLDVGNISDHFNQLSHLGFSVGEFELTNWMNIIRTRNKKVILVPAWAIDEDVAATNVFEPGWLNKLGNGLITEVWNQSGEAWKSLLNEMADKNEPENVIVVAGHPAILLGLVGQCLNLTKDWIGSFHLDAGSISVIDFPDGPSGRGVVRCINYTAHLGRWSIPITRPTVDDEEF